MARALPWVIAILLVVTAGAVHGWRTNRWSLADEVQASAAKLDGLPLSFKDGEWLGEEKEMDPEERELAEISGYKMRVYRHAQKKELTVRVMIAFGRPGPICVHTPDICMGGAGFTSEGKELKTVKLEEGLADAEFKVGRFRIEGGPTAVQQQRVYWAWSTNGDWVSPDSPRWKFFNCPVLFKLYVSHDEWAGRGKYVEAIYDEFLRILLVELHKCLQPS